MDTITHIVLGAVIAEPLIAKQTGKRALFLGAAAQSLPDIDFVAAFWLPATDNLLAHRGFTHSILFVVLLTPVLSLVTKHWLKQSNVSLNRWMLFFSIQLFVHLLIDTCNAYGVGLLEPLGHQRFSFNLLFVADPFYSSSLAIAFIVLVLLKDTDTRRLRWAYVGLIISTFYVFHAVVNKFTIERKLDKALLAQSMGTGNRLTTPTLFNNWLWYVVAESDSGFHIGYTSVFGEKEEIDFTHFNRNEYLLTKINDKPSVDKLKRFSQGFYVLTNERDTVCFNDLRFSQIAGWHNPRAPFVFHYYLQYPEANKFVLQRGRFTGWNKEVTHSFLEHMRGKMP